VRAEAITLAHHENGVGEITEVQFAGHHVIYRRDELLAADELIICSSAKAALHAQSVDGQLIGDGRPGPVTRKLQAAWPAYYLAH
jgi:branched-subunit amino acid aminotransferase/4-amino-4-deoxychorismate lyase